jgi:hypothetical protein
MVKAGSVGHGKMMWRCIHKIRLGINGLGNNSAQPIIQAGRLTAPLNSNVRHYEMTINPIEDVARL